MALFIFSWNSEYRRGMKHVAVSRQRHKIQPTKSHAWCIEQCHCR